MSEVILVNRQCKKQQNKFSSNTFLNKCKKGVEAFIKTHVNCILASSKQEKHDGVLNPMHKGNSPLHTLHLNHIGPLPSKHMRMRFLERDVKNVSQTIPDGGSAFRSKFVSI